MEFEKVHAIICNASAVRLTSEQLRTSVRLLTLGSLSETPSWTIARGSAALDTLGHIQILKAIVFLGNAHSVSRKVHFRFDFSKPHSVDGVSSMSLELSDREGICLVK